MSKTRHRQLVGFLAALVLASTVLLACGNQPGVVEGTVTQAADGAPVAQAEIVVYGLQRAEGSSQVDIFQKEDVLLREPTAEDGSYSLSLMPGNYIIQVWTGDEGLDDRLVEVKSGRKTQLDFEVAEPGP